MNKDKMLAVIQSTEISKEDSQLIIEDQNALKDLLIGVLVNADPHVCVRMAEYLSLLSRGYWHRMAVKRSKVSFATMQSHLAHYPQILSIYHMCKDSGEDTRQAYREERLDRFALRGLLEPVFYKGKKIGVIRKYNPKYLEMALKGGDKEGKFADKHKIETTDKAIHYHLHMPARGSTPEQNKPIIEITPENATKSQPEDTTP